MVLSSFINKQTVISGVTFATNNFVAILSHRDLPSEFHIIQDFLTSSSLKYALTEPASVSLKSVMQVWNTTIFGKGPTINVLMQFEFNGFTHHVTPAIVEEALHLPILGDKVPDNVTDSEIFEFVTKLGYNGEVKRYGSLFRTKLKIEWNFFFDTISRCFLNKTSNFDALPSGSLKIGYSLIYSQVFDYGSLILKALSDRKSDKLVISFTSYVTLCFTLDKFTKDGNRGNQQGNYERKDYDKRDNDQDRNPKPRGPVINMIFGGPTVAGSSRNSRKVYVREVMTVVGEAPKRAKTEVAISFDDSDLEGVKFPHDDPLVIIPVIGNSKTKRVLVHNGASVDILFHDAFIKMGYTDLQLTPSNMPIYGFNGVESKVEGTIQLPMTIGKG
ncbi:hypothetical protein POM88_003010 [Heracleum sosnowskyi]|uniref:Uncharacterized protein n=1 Tax=Heracleum sosnowskyi TaxID=360622 RepID=A0AAD8JJR7_9APIA|nr:hypothetical protein POM88_003010 [Heracleum sosnowskyi]